MCVLAGLSLQHHTLQPQRMSPMKSMTHLFIIWLHCHFEPYYLSALTGTQPSHEPTGPHNAHQRRAKCPTQPLSSTSRTEQAQVTPLQSQPPFPYKEPFQHTRTHNKNKEPLLFTRNNVCSRKDLKNKSRFNLLFYNQHFSILQR